MGRVRKVPKHLRRAALRPPHLALPGHERELAVAEGVARVVVGLAVVAAHRAACLCARACHGQVGRRSGRLRRRCRSRGRCRVRAAHTRVARAGGRGRRRGRVGAAANHRKLVGRATGDTLRAKFDLVPRRALGNHVATFAGVLCPHKLLGTRAAPRVELHPADGLSQCAQATPDGFARRAGGVVRELGVDVARFLYLGKATRARHLL